MGTMGSKACLCGAGEGGECGLFLELSVFGQSHAREKCDKLLR